MQSAMRGASPGLLQTPCVEQRAGVGILVGGWWVSEFDTKARRHEGNAKKKKSNAEAGKCNKEAVRRVLCCRVFLLVSRGCVMVERTTFVKDKLWWLVAFLWFAAWHFGFTWQVWGDPLHRVPGPIGDNTVMLWNLGWVQYALSHGSLGFWFTNAYFPDGFMFLYGTHTWLDGVLYWMASPVLPDGYQGGILWANIMMLAATTATGLLVIAGLRAWGVKQWPVLIVASSAVAFSWFRMFAITGHYHFFGTQWMLLSLWLVSLARQRYGEGSRKGVFGLTALGGFVLGVSFLNDQAMAVFAGLLGGLVLISLAVAAPDRRLRVFVGAAAWFYGFALVSASIHLVPMLLAISDGRLQYSVNTDGLRLVDASSLIVPPDRHLIGRYLGDFREQHGFTWSEGTYMGVIPLIFLLMSSVASLGYLFKKTEVQDPRLRVVFYATVAGWVFLVFALGDVLKIGREEFASMPGRLLKQLPVLNNIRLPQRWVWPAHLCVALAGSTVFSILVSRPRRRYLVWLPMAVAFIPGLEGLKYPPAEPTDYRHHPYMRLPGLVESVKRHYKGGGVLIMPVEKYFAHSNILQFEWGYDIPVTVSYTARMPFAATDVPWSGNVWTPESGAWLREKRVSIVAFSFDDGGAEDFRDWIREAKGAVPGLVVVNRLGREL